MTTVQPNVLGKDSFIRADSVADKAMLFDGTSGSITLPGTLDPSTWAGFTAELWVKLSNNTFTDYLRLISNDESQSSLTGVDIAIAPSGDGNSGYFIIGVGDDVVVMPFGSGVLSASTWYHIACAYDGTTMNAYINGTLAGTLDVTASIAATSNPLHIASSAYSNDYVPGVFDEVALYDHALSGTAISTHYTVGTTGSSDYATAIAADSPIAYYRLNETSGTAAADNTGHGYTGTIVGSVTLNQAGAIAPASSWGSADDGQAWAITSGNALLSISGNKGQVTGSTVANYIQLGSKSSRDSNTVVTIQTDNNAITSLGIVARQTGVNTLYRARINTSNNTFAIVKTIAGTSTDIASASFTASLNTAYKIRFKLVNDQLYARIWLASSLEPTVWTVKGSDTAISTAGGVGVTYNCTSSTGKGYFSGFYSLDYEPNTFNGLSLLTKTKQAGSKRGANNLTSSNSRKQARKTRGTNSLTSSNSRKQVRETRGASTLSTANAPKQGRVTRGASTLTSVTKATVTPFIESVQETLTTNATILGYDSFNRPNQSGFGTTPTGDTWAITSGNATLSIDTVQGLVTGSTIQNFIRLGSKSSRDANIVVTVKFDSTNMTSSGITARQTGPDTLYRARINSNNNTFALVKTIAGASTDIASAAFTPTLNTAYKIRFKLINDRLYARVWDASTLEPTVWTVKGQDTAITGAGGVGITSFCSSSTGKAWYSGFYALDYEHGSFNKPHFTDSPKLVGKRKGTSSLTSTTRGSVTPSVAGVRGISSLTATTKAKQAGKRKGTNNHTLTSKAKKVGKVRGVSSLTTKTTGDNTPRHLDRILLNAKTTAKRRGTVRGSSSLTIIGRGGVQIRQVSLPDGVSVWIAGEQIRYKEATLNISAANKQRKTASFTVYDPSGTVRYSKGIKVEIKHNVLGTIFSGVINDATENNLYPNDDNFIKVRCIDKSWFPLKRLAKRDYSQQYAGFIFTDLLDSIKDEGITANYAARRDINQTSLAQGTLSNVTSTADGLTLASAGSTVTHTFPALATSPAPAIKLTGKAAIPGGGNMDAYRVIWRGTKLVHTGARLIYDIWVSSTSPEIRGGVDVSFTDGTNLRNLAIDISGTDQNGLHPSPESDMVGLADNQWYHRLCGFGDGIAGKTISAITVGLEAFSPGEYTIYVRNISITDSGGNVTVFNGTLQQTKPATTRQTGFKDVSLEVVSIHDINAYKYAIISDDTVALDAVGIARDSLISWSDSLPPDTESHVYVSVDGPSSYPSTWQECTNNAPIPAIIPGMKLTGQKLRLVQTISTTNPDPTLPASINPCTVTVYPSYASSKSDVIKSYLTPTDFNTGTYSGTKMNAGLGFYLQLDGDYRDYEDSDYNQHDIIAGFTSMQGRKLALETTTNGFAITRLAWIGEQTDFIYEESIKVEDHGNSGVEYRTDTFTGANSYAYAAMVGVTGMTLKRGADNGTTTTTTLATVPLTLTSGDWHILRVEIVGSSHKIYLDGVLMITVTDSTHASGQIALRYENTNGVNNVKAYFDNVGYVKALSGTWVSPAIDISGAVTYGSSLVRYTPRPDVISDLISYTVETTLDNGTTWQAVSNGGAISGLTAGASLAGKTLKIRVTLATTNPSVIPMLWSLTAWVMGKYSSTGTRVSPALDLSTAGRAGSSLVSTNATIPTGTSLQIQAGPNTSTWSNVSSGGAIPFLTHQTDPLTDPFDSDTSAGYTLVTRTGGQALVPTWDTTNGRLIISGGLEGLLRADSVDFQDGEVWFDVKQSDQGGIIGRCQDKDNYYDVAVYDSASSVQNNIIQLYRVAGGTRTLLTVGPIDFPRGTAKRIRVVFAGAKITVYFDGIAVIDHTDVSPLLVSGKTGFRAGYTATAGASYYQSLRIQGYGQDLTGVQAYSKLTLTSNDARYTPIIPELILLCNNPDIAVGALIKEAKYALEKTVAEAFDDLASKSSYNWDISADNKASFLPPTASPAPWIATTESPDLLLGIEVERSGDLYRNWQYVKGCIDTIALAETFEGDGKATSWSLGYAVNEAPTITLNGVKASVGLKGQTGFDFYYEVGSPTIAQDESASPVAKGVVIVITYLGQVRATVQAKDDTEILARQAIEGGSGIVENSYDATDQNLSVEAGEQLAQALLDEYKVIGTTVRFGTLKHGLAPGQLLPLTVSQHGIQDELHLITSVNTRIDTRSRQAIAIHQAAYDIECTSGPDIGNWIHLYKKKA